MTGVQEEWGVVFAGSILVSAADEHGRFQAEELGFGDVSYFPKSTAHTIQGLNADNELLLVIDQPKFKRRRVIPRPSPPTLTADRLQHVDRITFEVDDWFAHTRPAKPSTRTST